MLKGLILGSMKSAHTVVVVLCMAMSATACSSNHMINTTIRSLHTTFNHLLNFNHDHCPLQCINSYNFFSRQEDRLYKVVQMGLQDAYLTACMFSSTSKFIDCLQLLCEIQASIFVSQYLCNAMNTHTHHTHSYMAIPIRPRL